MRDLYNRKEKLTHWINKAKTELNEPDRTHVLQFVEYMQEKDNSILWIVRCITALIYIRKQLDKPFVIVRNRIFRKILKIFIKLCLEKMNFIQIL
jgi:hypothetical protein